MSSDVLDKTLVFVEDLDKYLGLDGKVSVDLYNNLGTLVFPAGKIVKNPKRLPPVYVFEKVKNKDYHFESCKSIVDDSKSKLKVAEDVFGRKKVQKYNDAVEALSGIMSSEITTQNFSSAKNIIYNTSKDELLTLSSCIQSIRDIDSYTLHHSLAVGLRFDLAMHLLRKYNKTDWFFDVFKESYNQVSFAEENIKNYSVGALLHDVGKISVDQEVLLKKGPLTDDEFEEMKNHPKLGVNHLKSAGIKDLDILSIVGNHHAGYLSFDYTGQSTLPVICSIIDIHDACRSKRCYKDPLSEKDTYNILQKESQRYGWHSSLVKVMLDDVIPVFEKDFKKLNIT